MFLRPSLQLRRGKRAAPLGKVELAQEAIHPDIAGKGVPAAVGVKKNAAGDFRADAGQLLKVPGGTFGGPNLRDFQVFRFPGENFGGGGQVFGAVAELALAQSLFASPSEASRGGKITTRSPEGPAEAVIDLANLDDLFEGRADKVGETFPWILAERAEAGMGLKGFRQPAISLRGGMEEGGKVEIEAEVLFQGGDGKQGVIPEKPSVADRKRDGLIADPAGKLARGGLVPAKRLAAQEGGGEIERNGELQSRHRGRKLKAS